MTEVTQKKIILQIKGLRLEAVRGGAVIVDNVDVTLHAGEVLGLIGESGAGKSTIGLAAMSYARAGVHIAVARSRSTASISGS